VPYYLAVLKNGSVIESYYLDDPELQPPPGDPSKPLASWDAFDATEARLSQAYPEPEYEIVQGGTANLDLLVANRGLAYRDYDYLIGRETKS
jgi:hypothetical protein